MLITKIYWHTGKVGPRTLRYDPGSRNLRWDHRVLH